MYRIQQYFKFYKMGGLYMDAGREIIAYMIESFFEIIFVKRLSSILPIQVYLYYLR